MAATIEALINVALARMGDKSLVGTLGVTTSEPTLSANILYGPCRQNLLRAFPWNFAMARRVLDDAALDALIAVQTMGLTLSTTTGYMITVTAASGVPFAIANDVIDKNIMEKNSGTGAAIITARTSDTIATVDVINNFSSTTISASNWKIRYGPPAFGYTYRYALSNLSNQLRIWKVNGKDKNFKVEGGFLLSNDSNVRIEYIVDITDPTKFDSVFDDVYEWLLAYELSLRLSSDKGVHDRMWKKYEEACVRAESVHSKEGSIAPLPKWWHEAGRPVVASSTI